MDIVLDVCWEPVEYTLDYSVHCSVGFLVDSIQPALEVHGKSGLQYFVVRYHVEKGIPRLGETVKVIKIN